MSDVAGRAWSVLVEATERLSGARSIPEVVETVRAMARRIAGADGVTFVLREGDCCHYVEENAIAPLWKGQRFPMTSCISGWAMLNRRTAVVPDIFQDPRIPHDVYRPTFVRSLVMVPVRVDDPLAAIGAYWAARREPGPQEIALLEALARSTATALANVALAEELREAALHAMAQAEEIRRHYDESLRQHGERLKAEERLRQAQKMEAIGQLTGGMAHDFNNVLAIVAGNLELLLDGLDPAEARACAAEALDAASRGADLIRRLLAFARHQPLAPRQLRVNAFIDGIGQLLRRTLGDRIALSLDLAEDVWPVVADPAQLEASIVNLATNARDAMRGGGRLAIATANRRIDADAAAQLGTVAAGDYVAIEVADDGCGMPPEVAARVFEPFFTTKERGRGTGLGLAMVASFAEQSGGRVSLYTEPGKGSVFRLYLPRAADGAPEAAAATGAIPRGRGQTVLVVEDSAPVRRVVVRVLGELGYRVLEAADGERAAALLDAEAIDLLFIDLVIAGAMTGADLAAAAPARHPGLRVLLTSGFPDAVAESARPAGVPLLTKPYRREELARAVRAVLDGEGAP